MKLALLALTAFVFTSCTNTLYTHRADFSPSPAKGPWTDLYKGAKRGEDPAHPGKRALYRRTD